jgi:ubiquinol oxidase
MLLVDKTDLDRHHVPDTLADRIALRTVRVSTAVAGFLFGRRYGDRVVVLETIAAVPSMVAATLLHLKCLRRMLDDRGWVRTFMDEAENQRVHLMSFIALARPRLWERILIAVAQAVFCTVYFILYLVSARLAHRLAAYFSEQAVRGYSEYLARLQSDDRGGNPAPASAIAYWALPQDASVADMILAMREDEAIHRDLHHAFAEALAEGLAFPRAPASGSRS